MDEKDLSILYRPQVDIERDYRSDGVILHEPVTNETPEQKQERTVPEVQTDLEEARDRAAEVVRKLIRIRKITPVLPTDAQETVNDLLDTVIVWTGMEIPKLEEIIEQDKAKPDEEKYEIPGNDVTVPEHIEEEEPSVESLDETETESESSDNEWPVMTSSGFVFNVIKNKDSWDLAYDQYLLDSTEIQEDFAEEFNNVMEGYVYQLVSAMDEIGLDAPEYLNMPYEGESVTGVPTNYQHLNDIIVRNQDTVSDLCDIFRKTHDEYTTYGILAAYDVASQERIRYLKEKYKDETAANYIEMYDKNYLAKSRDEFEQRYVTARTNVYKLLHSASQITKEILAAQLELAISKCSLLNKEVNIFAKKEYENMEYANSTQGTVKDVSDTSKSQGVTETTPQAKDKNKVGDINIEQFTIGGGFGGAIKNNVKTVQNKTKEAETGAENAKKKAQQKGQNT